MHAVYKNEYVTALTLKEPSLVTDMNTSHLLSVVTVIPQAPQES